MFKWIPTIVLFMPRWLASFSTALLLLASIGFFIWLHQQPNYLVGTLESIASVPHGEQMILEISDPLSELIHGTSSTAGHLVMAEPHMVMGLKPDSVLWLMAMGEESSSQNGFDFLQATEVFAITKPWVKEGFLTVIMEGSGYPLVAIILGGILIFAGPLMTRFLSSLVLGAMMCITSWHAIQVARHIDAIVLADGLVTGIALLALAVGVIIGIRARRDSINVAVERVALLLLVVICMPHIADWLALPKETTLIAILLCLVVPSVGYALLGGYGLAVGMQASIVASWIILLVALSVVMVLRAAFPSEQELVLQRMLSGSNDDPRRNVLYRFLT